MNKQIAAMLIAITAATTVCTTADASWLGNILKNLPSSGSSTTASSSSSSSPTRAARWSKVYSTDNYTIYIDTSSMKASGQAQSREITAWFKREFSPVGSQWLGDNSNGRVKPDVITHSVYQAVYRVNRSYYWANTCNYYDANNHLIYKSASLADMHDEVGFGDYVPDSPNEQIKDILFNAVGWNY